MSDVVARVIELFESTCSRQFESMHCEIHPLSEVGSRSLESSICASISCFSDDIAITLTIAADKGFLVNTIPMIGGQRLDTLSFQNDWCLELANRFLGRLKNKLLSHNCTLNMGLPVLIGVSEYQKTALNSDVSKVFQINGAEGAKQIRCTLSVSMLNNEMVLGDYEDEDEDWFEESELDHL